MDSGTKDTDQDGLAYLAKTAKWTVKIEDVIFVECPLNWIASTWTSTYQ